MAARAGSIPASLQSFAVVPIAGSRLASVEQCIQYQAVSQAHLNFLPSSAADVLTAVGCICITEKRADSASPIFNRSEPLTEALNATARRLGLPLQQLLSQQRSGDTQFTKVRQLLAQWADIMYISANRQAWQTLSQCPIYENIDGNMTAIPSNKSSWGLLPGESWEQHMSQLNQLLCWTPVRYSTASVVQRSLLSPSGKKAPSLASFLQEDLLPAINGISSSNISSLEPLLLQALDEIAQTSCQRLSSLRYVIIDNRLHPISKTVDSSNALLQNLFKISTDHDYKLLPQQYTTPHRLAELKRHKLAHEHTPDPDFFFTCSARLRHISSSSSRDDSK